MSIGYNDIWVGGGVDQGWVGTVLPKVLLRWMPSRKEKGWHCFTKGVAAVDTLAKRKKVGTVLPKVLLRWIPSRLSPLVVAAVSAAAAADDDDDGGGGDFDGVWLPLSRFFFCIRASSAAFRVWLMEVRVSARRGVQ